ncbi:MAG: hypothetical protein JWN23_2246 [Rhodocyclales bacterium]|nr:hypothetical protein [Rhodocyclales bacterium]
MPGSFLDTTVLVHLAEKIEPHCGRAKAYVRVNPPAETPYYALKEVLESRVRAFCEAHNILHASENAGVALAAMAGRNPVEGRILLARIKVLADALTAAFESHGAQDKREMLQWIAIRANQVWRGAQKRDGVRTVQALSCFVAGKLWYGEAGDLRGPSDGGFGCSKSSSDRCAAAAYMHADKSSLAKMIDALHPSKLPTNLAEKNENQKRRKALKELQKDGPAKFNKGRCRALGDAYFASMCPGGATVLTSNIVDHEILCNALGKKAETP